jgi:competence ComEA-like helix-hairpin-helix protein
LLDFTKSERKTVLFLLACFGLGMAIKSYRHFHPSVPVFKETERLSVEGASNPTAVNEETHEARIARPSGIRLNRASLEELERIPGIGPVLGKRILDYRIQHGGFRSPGELMKVKGIGRKKFNQISPFLMMD